VRTIFLSPSGNKILFFIPVCNLSVHWENLEKQ
jgi:hypothetical protein